MRLLPMSVVRQLSEHLRDVRGSRFPEPIVLVGHLSARDPMRTLVPHFVLFLADGAFVDNHPVGDDVGGPASRMVSFTFGGLAFAALGRSDRTGAQAQGNGAERASSDA